MKRLPRLLFAIAVATAASHAVAAEADGFYAGIGTGRIAFDFDDARFRTSTGAIVSGRSLNLDPDSGLPLRLSAGYNWGGWAVELGYEQILKSADLDAGSGGLGDFDYRNFTAGGVYRSSGDLYFIGKFGLSMPDLEGNSPGIRLKLGNSGYYGAGLGYRFTPSLSAEFDYTQTNDDTGAFLLNLRRHF